MSYYTGEIIAFAGNFIPENFQLCNGALLSISGNELLYNMIGHIYGGDGVKYFALPNLKGLVITGTGNSKSGTFYALGKAGGRNSVELLVENLPQHNHQLLASTNNATTGNPTSNVLAASVPGQDSEFKEVKIYESEITPNATLNAETLAPTGKNLSHSNLQPYLTISYIICINGEYPVPASPK